MALRTIRKIFNTSVSFVRSTGSFLFLFALLVFGWSFLNVVNLIKGKQSNLDEKSLRSQLFKANVARADVPKGTSTPFLAYFDGKEYKLENDIMFGRPKSYHESYEIAKSLYDDGRIYPDLYKINAPIKPYGGKLLFQIQEIETEESYFKWLRLKRVVHPKNTEVFVDSEYRKFYVADTKQLEQDIVLPDSAVKGEENAVSLIADKRFLSRNPKDITGGLVFQKGDAFEMTFKNLKPGKVTHLVIKSWFRDWVLGLEENRTQQTKLSFHSIFDSQTLRRASVALPMLLAGWYLNRKGLTFATLSFFPFVIGDCGTDGAGTAGTAGDTAGEYGSSDSSKDACCFAYQYKDKSGNYRLASISEPRAWQYNTEFIELPKEAVLPDGTLAIKMTAGRKQVLGFIGAIQGVESIQQEYREEEPELMSARHNRLEKEVSDVLKNEQGEYVQTIPGDTMNLEFSAPKLSLSGNERETYLIRASGFYTSLREKNRIAAGNWRDRVSNEAKMRLSNLV